MENPFGVIFDMDGVIVDSNPIHKKSIKRFCKKYHKEVSDGFLKERVFGRKNSDWIPELFGSINFDQLHKLSREKEELFRELFDPRQNCVNGLIDFVEDLHKYEIPMAVATSAPDANSSYILRDLSIRDRFKAVLHTSDVKKGKPAPDIYEAAAAALRLKPQQ